MDEQNVIIANRVSLFKEEDRAPYPGSIAKPCCECGEDCYVSPATLKAAGEDAVIKCIECIDLSKVNTKNVIPIDEAQAKEIIALLIGEDNKN